MIIDKKYVDFNGHVNNAAYLEILEAARWQLLKENNFTREYMIKMNISVVILEINIKFLKELKAEDSIVIHTKGLPFQKKIGSIEQAIYRDDELCSTAFFKYGFFDIQSRHLILPTEELLKFVGM